MNENGIVNIYLIVLSYLFAPNTLIDEELIVDEEGNVTATPTSVKDREYGKMDTLSDTI